MKLLFNSRRHKSRRLNPVNASVSTCVVDPVVKSLNHVVKSMMGLILCISMMFVCVFSVNASTFGLQAVNKVKGKLIQHSNTQQDMFVPAAPKKGISYNKFTEFTVSGKPLVIFNGGDSKGAFRGQAPAKLIVIEATKMNLQQDIKIVGQPADVLLLVKGAKQTITCKNCGFDNINRVTMAVATMGSKPEDMLKKGKVGQLTARSGGTIKVNNLSAPGILSLELLADNIATAGMVDLNLHADLHPQGGYIVHPKGNKTVGSGGINLYSGELTFNYDDLAIKAAKESSKSHTVGGELKAASIAIASPKKIVIAKGAKLNTSSDILATSTHNGQFYAPNEGIYLQTIAASKVTKQHQGVDLKGTLLSDNLLSIKSVAGISIAKSAKIITHDAKLLAIGGVRQQGLIQADNQVDIAAKRMINNDKITAGTLNIETTDNIHNSFGGRLKATKMALKANKGFVINGSRSQREVYSDGSLKALPLTRDPTALKFGIFYDVNEKTGKVNKQVSAHILASTLAIEAKAVENINPYQITAPKNKPWTASIKVDNRQAQQVSIQAENQLNIKAHLYLLNSSAIISANQAGKVTIDTPTFSNERYGLETKVFAYNQEIYDPKKPKEQAVGTVGVGAISKIVAYSPPARFYTFGDLHMANHSKAVQKKGAFINEFSYVELFQNSHFKGTQIHSIGLNLTQEVDQISLMNVRDCMRSRQCEGQHITTSIEGETLLAFHGSVYGVNNKAADLVIDDLDVLEHKKKQAVDKYLDSITYFKAPDDLVKVIEQYLNKDKTLLHGTLEIRKPLSVEEALVLKVWGEFFKKNTEHIVVEGNNAYKKETKKFTQSITELLNEAVADEEIEDTGYTPNQIKAAAKNYFENLNEKIEGGVPCQHFGVVRYEYISHTSTKDNKKVIVSGHQVIHCTVPVRGVKKEITKTIPLKKLMTYLPK
ncbi:hypothetical protein [uncultured Shewanella sp.]|uniref:hypothetical protein n=1 Tax=uncultured Shewanella sp. TaxID=173975 RepID=UPI002625BFF4|nr:hypothetical protein [uncultured Shewanella sp.]